MFIKRIANMQWKFLSEKSSDASVIQEELLEYDIIAFEQRSVPS